METSIKIDSRTRRSVLAVKQRFTNSENYCLTLHGSIDLQNAQQIRGRAYVRKKNYFFSNSNNNNDLISARIDLGCDYDTTTDEVTYKLVGKKSFDLTNDGLTTIDCTSGCDFALSSSKPQLIGKIELTKTMFNFQADQDLRMKLGIERVSSRNDIKYYGQIRENNWTLNVDFKSRRWDVQYDL
jgi:hypothetical protein